MTTTGKILIASVVTLVLVGAIWLFTSGGPGPLELRSGTANYAVRLRLDTPKVGPNPVSVEISDLNGQPVTADEVTIEPLMLEMNHALPPTPASPRTPGTYRAEHVDLLMTGRWELTVGIRRGGVLEYATFTLVL